MLTFTLKWVGDFIEGTGRKKLRFTGADLAELRGAIASKCSVEEATFNLSYHDEGLAEVVDLDDYRDVKGGLVIIISERPVNKRRCCLVA